MTSEIPDRFCEDDSRKEVVDKWRSPFSFELLVSLIVLPFAVWLAYLTAVRVHSRVEKYKAKIERLSRTLSLRSVNEKHSLHLRFTTLLLPLPREEFFALCLVCLCEVCVCIRVLLFTLHYVPQFEDSLVTDKQKHKQLSADFSALVSWCRFHGVMVVALPSIVIGLALLVFGTRLLSIFNRETQTRALKLPRIFALIVKLVLVVAVILTLSAIIAAICSYKSFCIQKWATTEDGNEYYHCSFQVPQWFTTFFITISFLSNTGNVIILALYFNRFLKLLSYRRTSSIVSQTSDSASILKTMEKLTVLATTAICSSLLMYLFYFVFVATALSSQWCYVADMCINTLCLLLVFKWMDDVYVALFWHRFCCVRMCVRNVIGCQLGIGKHMLDAVFDGNPGLEPKVAHVTPKLTFSKPKLTDDVTEEVEL